MRRGNWIKRAEIINRLRREHAIRVSPLRLDFWWGCNGPLGFRQEKDATQTGGNGDLIHEEVGLSSGKKTKKDRGVGR